VGTRILLCDWGDRFTLKEALLGGSLRAPGGIEVGFTDPETFPDWPELAAVGLQIEPIGAVAEVGSAPDYDYAQLTVRYEPLTWTPGSSEESRIETTETREHAMEVLMLPAGGFMWGAAASNAGTPIAQNAAVYMPVTTRIFTRTDLTEIPDTVQSEIGNVNDAVYLGADIGHMMYAGSSVERRIGYDGSNNYQVRYNFKQKDHDWNYLWHPVDENWVGIVSLSSSDPPFAYSDFKTILTGV